MNPHHDYASIWPELFRFVPAGTRDSVLHALAASAVAGSPPTEADARTLLDFATGQITAKEYARRTLARLSGQPEEPMADMASVPAPSPVEPPKDDPAAIEMLDHESAALAFVRGEVTAAEYLRNVRGLGRRTA